jgi:3-isopropylmalate dehydratase small subunit
VSATVTIDGPAFVVAGDIAADAIVHPRHMNLSDPAELAPHCLAGLAHMFPFTPDGRWPILISSGLFGVGLVRPQVPAALKGAGVRVVVAPAFSPLFVEHSLNAGMVLPLRAELSELPPSGTPVTIMFANGRAHLSYPGHASVWTTHLPDWALMGRTWIGVLKQRMDAPGKL